MSELSVARASDTTPLVAVGADGRRAHHEQPSEEHGERREPSASPELALALRGHASVSAAYEQGPDGAPLIRIVDRTRNETIALLTPEELQQLAAPTGLPPGLLMRLES